MDGLLMKYFVLKPSGTDQYAEASRNALRQYAKDIEQVNPILAKNLRDWADKEMKASQQTTT